MDRAAWPWECDSSSAGPEAQVTGGKTQDPALPQGQAEARRSQRTLNCADQWTVSRDSRSMQTELQ